MSGKKVVILDGCGLHDQDVALLLGDLSDVVRGDGSQIETFPLHSMKLAHCLGCFGCWLKTPGMCVEDDAGRQVARAIVQSDTTVLYTPATFGGYSPDWIYMRSGGKGFERQAARNGVSKETLLDQPYAV